MEKIKVPFLRKEDAIMLGAKFDRNERIWFIPQELGEENKEKLRQLKNIVAPSEEPENTQEDTSDHTYMRQQYYDWDGSDRMSDVDGSKNINNDEQNSDDFTDTLYVKYDVPDKLSTLRAALLIFENGGMPETEAKRIKLLKCLANPSRQNYPIDYDGMISCEGFNRAYPEELITNLIVGKITGKKKLDDEIDDLDISDEYKMLLHFALPI